MTQRPTVREIIEVERPRAAPIPRELFGPERAKASTRLVNSLYRLFDEYVTELQESELSAASIEDYRYFAECFVRWLHNDYTPGQGVK